MNKSELADHILAKHPELVHPSTKSALMGCRKEELVNTHERLHRVAQGLSAWPDTEPRSVAPDAYTRTGVYLGERRDV